MARPTSITCVVGKTLNTGNYSSLRLEWAETWEVAEGDDVEKLAVEIKQAVRDELEALQKGCVDQPEPGY